ncbi:hypothetical protein [Acinetobacter sp.]|uniref:hypothetical protein n=1 Tax=Acinetobacter sp. TaxID=472 RepID=UPI003D0295A7
MNQEVYLDPLDSIQEAIIIEHSDSAQFDLFAAIDEEFNAALDSNVIIEWSADQLRTLQDHLLSSSFSIFADIRTTADSRSEILDWVLDESKFPFSYLTCCSSMGLNHEELREKFLQILKKLEK